MLAGPSMRTQLSYSNQNPRNFSNNRAIPINVAYLDAPVCICCHEQHHLITCEKFKSLDTSSRRNVVQNNKICYNCLSQNHLVTSCSSRFGCKQCRRRHHTLLHDNENTTYNINKSQVHSSHTPSSETLKINNIQADEKDHNTEDNNIQINLATNLKCFSTMLPTALVNVKDITGKFMPCRILLDSGSEASFISEACVQKLGLLRSYAKIAVSGIATANQYTRGVTSLFIQSRVDRNKTFEMNVLILQKLTTVSPVSTFSIEDYNCIKNLRLADPKYDQVKEIDIVLGSNKFFEVLEDGRVKGSDGKPIAQNTAFGWVLAGESSNLTSNIHNLNIVLDEDTIDFTLRKFFECEELDDPTAPLSKEEADAEENYKANVTRQTDGRYMVALPFKYPKPILGHSESMATQRLKSVERRMSRDTQYKKLYSEFMESYLKLGHMEQIKPEDSIANDRHCYLPHHAVLKTSSVTTKLRTVFDGSSRTSNGLSLNDNLMVGPTIQPTLWSILMRFRIHPVALCADVEKMYRQIRIRKEDTNFQRIVWRQSPDLPIQHFRLKTVTYGTSAASFLAIRSLVQLANDSETKYPHVAKIIRNSFYVDDLLWGANCVDEAIGLKAELNAVMSSGGFSLRKWVSNIPVLCDAKNPVTFNDKETTIKILGLFWDPKRDTFEFNVKLGDGAKCTKRTLLSEASKVFDPLGWLAPSIVIIKILFQKLWLYKIGWDEDLPVEIATQWHQLRSTLEQFKHIKIPRYISLNTESFQIHGFCDASESAYAAVIYSRVEDKEGNVHVNLLTSKTKVAPLKQVTLPRLELCAAVLLSRLMSKVKMEFSHSKIKEFGWTDSTIVLAWLSDQPRRWKTYVANRTSEILSILPRYKWDHVISCENPADCASRGILPETLNSFNLWWHGPQWLRSNESTWKVNAKIHSNADAVIEEERKKWVQCSLVQTSNETMQTIFSRISSWRKIRRVLSYCIRFIHNTKKKCQQNRNFGVITVDELFTAERACVWWCQQGHYAEDISNLRKSRNASSKLSALAPFVDGKDILRVGGRLQNAECAYDVKHPIILPNNHVLSKMMAAYYHLKYLHPGPSLLASLLKQRYWIVQGRSMIREIVHKCQVCVRQRAATSSQLMGTLPTSRVTIARPFSRVGVDFCGPINIATKKGRGAKSVKAYISVFICMMTKAIHLEVVSDLTANAFLAGLNRFIARRGLPAEINSDNGTNFIGASRQINNFYHNVNKVNQSSLISEYLNENGVKWKFITPASPNFAGLWEAAVKSTKAHLIRVAGNTRLTFEEIATLTTQIEAILNSRPLCQLKTDDSSDLDVLTPGHFLIMAPLTALPEPDFEEVHCNRLTRWEEVTKRVGSFWKRYSREYLHTLQQRSKWQHKHRNLQIGDIVLVKEDNLPPCVWLKGKIIDIHPGSDELVRVVTLRTSKSTIKRPVSKIIQLPVN